jgi:hypothetical protein
MMHKLFSCGSTDILVEIAETQDQQRLEELAIELGPIDVQPGEFYADVLAVLAGGIEYPEEFAAAALGIVRGAETINAMITRSRRDLLQSGLLPEPIVPSDDMVSDEIVIGLPNQLYPPSSADRLPRRWF